MEAGSKVYGAAGDDYIYVVSPRGTVFALLQAPSGEVSILKAGDTPKEGFDKSPKDAILGQIKEGVLKELPSAAPASGSASEVEEPVASPEGTAPPAPKTAKHAQLERLGGDTVPFVNPAAPLESAAKTAGTAIKRVASDPVGAMKAAADVVAPGAKRIHYMFSTQAKADQLNRLQGKPISEWGSAVDEAYDKASGGSR